MKLRNGILLGLAALLSVSVGLQVPRAQADPLSAMQSAPQGIKVDQYFTVPTTIGNGVTNAAKVLPDSGRSSLLPMDGVQLSSLGVHNTGSAIWSSDRSFDLHQNQRASMWVYVSGQGATANDTIGDGMAFVLQKDENHIDATGHSTAFSGAGESLGVWGVDLQSGTKNAIASTAIQNSWALEFDTRLNQTAPKSTGILGSKATPDYFDFGSGSGYNPGNGSTPMESIDGQHIASGYPGSEDTYTEQGTVTSGIKSVYYYTQNHVGLLRDKTANNFIGDAQWHHITVNYTAPDAGSTDGTIEYAFDDQDPTTGSAKSTDYYVKETLDTSKLGVGSTGDSKVYWGFTSSTGAKMANTDDSNSGTEDGVVVFEQVPGQVEASATATMTDTTQNKAVTKDTTINANDDVQLKYLVNYDGGNVDWQDIVAKLQLPKDVTFTKGVVNPADGNAFSLDDLASQGSAVSTNIGKLNQTSNQATITLFGTANNVTKTVTDTTDASSFVGTNGMTTATLPSFKIAPTALALKLDEASKDQTVNLGTTSATVSGTLKLGDATLANSDLTVYGSFDNGTVVKEDANVAGSGDTRTFNIQLTKDQLAATPNPHTLQLFVSDGAGAMSDPTTATIHMGQVTLGDTSSTLTFNPTFLNGADQTVGRAAGWSLNVNDSLATNSTWKLTAQTAGMFKNGVNAPGNELGGHLIYKATSDAQPQALGPAAVNISSGTSDGSVQTTNIADDWTADSGILLHLDGGASQGDYSGEIQWTLTSAP